MYERFVDWRVREALEDTPAVLIVGPRRAGKTTLVRQLGTDRRTYLTLDDQTTLDSAQRDPVGFVRALGDAATIDEVQRVPELLLAIKQAIDDAPRPGRFLLTGSANVLTLPRLADSLAGRMEIIEMLPLAHAEMLGKSPSFLENLFAGAFGASSDLILGNDLIQRVLTGGFPEALSRRAEHRRLEWGRSYLQAVLTRDLRDIAEIEKLTELPKFVRLLAQRSSQLVNYSELGSGIDVSHKTSQRYIALLERIFIVSLLSPWHANTLKRLVKTPKVQFFDTGILSASRGLTLERLLNNRSEFGPLLENFVYAEILRLRTGSKLRVSPYHFRDHQQREVDIVLERDDGRIAGVEVKASATVTHADFSGLRELAGACKDRFAYGVVLYDSDTVVPFGDRMSAVPISSLWGDPGQ